MNHTYTYDRLYRLVRSQDSEGRFNQYGYDAVGNRLSLSSNYDPLRTPTGVTPYTVLSSYNAANQLATTDHSVFGLTTYTYDGNGNRIRREGPDVWTGSGQDILRTDYSYDFENRLTWTGNFRDPGNGNWQLQDETQLTYDGYGRLFRRLYDMKQGSGGQKWTDYVYDGLDPIAEYLEPSGQYVNYYRGLGRILSMHEFKSQQSPNGTAYYFHHDGLGSVSALTKHQGQSAHTYRYADFGMALDKNGRAADSSNFTAPHNHYTYTGQEWDEETTLYHFYAREYDPVVGVWLQADPYRGRLVEPMTLHRYGYVENRPTMFTDSYGFCPNCVTAVVGSIGGAIAGGGANLVTQLIVNKGDISQIKPEKVLAATFGGAAQGAVCGFTVGLGCALAGGAVGGAVEQISYNLLTGQSFYKGVAGNAISGAIFNTIGSIGAAKLVKFPGTAVPKRFSQAWFFGPKAPGGGQAKIFLKKLTSKVFERSVNRDFVGSLISNLTKKLVLGDGREDQFNNVIDKFFGKIISPYKNFLVNRSSLRSEQVLDPKITQMLDKLLYDLKSSSQISGPNNRKPLLNPS